jgi:hypothetical protein
VSTPYLKVTRHDERELGALLAYLPAVPPAWREAAHAIPRLAGEGRHSLTEVSQAAADDATGEDVVRTPRVMRP